MADYLGKGGIPDMRQRIEVGEFELPIVKARVEAVEAAVASGGGSSNYDPGDIALIFENRLI